jgi:hypothetical protein
METPFGPATTFATASWGFPQNEQLTVSTMAKS